MPSITLKSNSPTLYSETVWAIVTFMQLAPPGFERLEIGEWPMAEAIAVELFLRAIMGFLPNLPL